MQGLTAATVDTETTPLPSGRVERRRGVVDDIADPDTIAPSFDPAKLHLRKSPSCQLRAKPACRQPGHGGAHSAGGRAGFCLAAVGLGRRVEPRRPLQSRAARRSVPQLSQAGGDGHAALERAVRGRGMSLRPELGRDSRPALGGAWTRGGGFQFAILLAVACAATALAAALPEAVIAATAPAA